jgi:hypothetical protein
MLMRIEAKHLYKAESSAYLIKVNFQAVHEQYLLRTWRGVVNFADR